MKSLYPLIACAVLSMLFFGCDQIKKDAKVEMKNTSKGLLSYKGASVVFYNVENLFDTHDDPHTTDEEFTPQGRKKWTSKRYQKKLADLSLVIQAIPSKKLPMLIGLCEVENEEVVNDLIKTSKLSKLQYEIVHEESSDIRGIDVALVYDKERFKYLDHESIPIEFPWDHNIKTRDLLYVKGEISSGEIIHVFVNHWSSRRKGKDFTEKKRIQIAKRLRLKIEQIQKAYPEDKMLIMGDFNDTPADKSLEEVLKAKKHSGLKDGELYNLMAHLVDKNKGTLVHNDQWEMLDQIIINKPFLQAKEGVQIQKDKGRILKKNWMLYEDKEGNAFPNKTYGRSYYGGFSDHLPVYVILK